MEEKGPDVRFCGLFVNSLSSGAGGGQASKTFFFSQKVLCSKILCYTSKNSCYNHVQVSSLMFCCFFPPLSSNCEVGEKVGEKSETINYENIIIDHNPSAPKQAAFPLVIFC